MRTKFIEQQKKIDTIAAEFEKTITSDEMKTTFNEFTVARQGYAGQLDVVINLASQNQDAEAFLYMGSGTPAAQATKAEQDAIDKIVALKLEDGQLKSNANTAQANTVLTTMIIITLIGIAIAIGFGLFLSSMISKPLKKANHMIKEMSMGHFSTRLNMVQKDEIGEMALSKDSFSDKIQTLVIGTMNRISDGDVSANIEIRDDQDEIAPALKQIIETIRGLIAEATMLSEAAVNGQLNTRGHAAAFKGGYMQIVEGVNATLDAVVGPLNVAADYVDRIGKGLIPPKITDSYNGDFNTLKNNLNACIDGLDALKEGNRVLGQMSVNDYSEKMEADHLGIYSEIAHSINNVHLRLTRIVEICTNIANGAMCDLDVLTKIGKRSQNDTLIPSLVGMIQNIMELVEETESMASTAVEGNLGNRGDASRFSGEYAKVIAGFNETLDAVIAPIQEASDTLNELSNGNLHISMSGDYRGDHATIKNDLNETIEFLKRYVLEITATLEAMGQGNLDQEIITTYLGDFLPIK